MGQSLVKNYVHIVFCTCRRTPYFFEPWDQELHAYLGGICNELKCTPIIIGGFTEHIHMLVNLSKNISAAKFMEEVKGHSSKWIKSKGKQYQHFAWQAGYAIFSVNPRQVENVINYIATQKEHHGLERYEDELRRFLIDNGMEFDERYLWD
jgi:putative transposase